MPSYPCKWPTCTEYLPERGYCREHAHHAPTDRRAQHQYYDRHNRDPESKKFYNSAAWLAVRQIKLDLNPLCEICGRIAEHVHHKIPIKIATAAQRLMLHFLSSVCAECHSKIEAEERKRCQP